MIAENYCNNTDCEFYDRVNDFNDKCLYSTSCGSVCAKKGVERRYIDSMLNGGLKHKRNKKIKYDGGKMMGKRWCDNAQCVGYEAYSGDGICVHSVNDGSDCANEALGDIYASRMLNGGKESLYNQDIKSDDGKPELSLVPWQIAYDIAECRSYGVSKYGDSESWREVELSRYINAMLRHALAFVRDNNGKDEESGIEHYKHAACNLAFICELMKGKCEDD